MNSFEEKSTFFITIEQKNVKSHINNFKNIKSKYFYRPIKSKNYKQNKNHNYSQSFHNNAITNNQALPLQDKIKKINNISKNNIMKNYRVNENKNNSFFW